MRSHCMLIADVHKWLALELDGQSGVRAGRRNFVEHVNTDFVNIVNGGMEMNDIQYNTNLCP